MDINLCVYNQPPKITMSSNKILKDNICKVICQLKPFSDNDSRKIQWTIDLVKEKSLECRTKSEFQIKYSGGHKAAKKYGILNDLFPVEDRPIRKSIWSYELMQEKSSECKNVSEFRKKYSGAYKVAKKLGYIDEFFPK
jgi:hypothetical protein